MKILMLTSFMNMGGAETHISELCLGLAAAGHTPEIASSGGSCADMLAASGITHHTLPLGRRDPLSALKSLLGLWRLIKHGGYDIVHAHSRIPAVMCAVLGVRYVSTAHLDFRVNPLLRRITKWGDYTMAVSGDIAEYLRREYGVSPENISLTVNGIDTARFAPSDKHRAKLREELGIADTEKLIVYISRLDRDRSLPAKLLCRVMPRLRREYPNTRLLIVGDGDDFDAVRSLAGEGTVLAGARYDIERITAAADIVCGVSRSALEGMASGCPVILSGNQGHMGIFTEDILENAARTNFCCRGCPLPTEEALFRDAEALLSLPAEELRRLGQCGRATVISRYSADRMVSDYTAMYEKAVRTSAWGTADAVVSGYFGYGNSGDDTALDCLVYAIRQEYPEAKIAVLCRDPEKFGRLHGVVGIGRYNVLGAIRALRQSRLLISGGGSLLQNVTSTRSLRYYAGVIHLARLCGAKVFICANGIGPIRGKTGRRIAYRAVSFADRISVRDEASKRTLAALGISEETVHVTADPAFRLVHGGRCDVSEVKKAIGMRDGERYFAVSVRSKMSGEFFAELCRACREIYLTLGYIPILVSMQESEDGELCRTLSREICGEAIFLPPLSPNELCSLISETELVLTMRLHLMIYAASVGIPAVGVSVDPKLDAVAEVIGYPTVSSGERFSADECLAAMRRSLRADREQLIKIAREQAVRFEGDAAYAVRMMGGDDGTADGCNVAAPTTV